MLLDQEMFVSIEAQPSGWLFTGLLGERVSWQRKDFLQDLLALNLTLMQRHGGAIAFHPESGAILYASRLSLSQLDGDTAYEFLEEFVDQLESLTEWFQAQ